VFTDMSGAKTIDMKASLSWSKHLGSLSLAFVLLMDGASGGLSGAELTNSIVWHAEANTLDVDIDNKPLSVVVADFKKATGRDIFVPPGMTKTVSLKFSGKPTSEGLARILDGFNYYTEHRGTESRIVIVDPNGSPPVPTGVRPMPMPRPPSPTGTVTGRPPGMSPSVGGLSPGMNGSRGDSRGGGTTGERDRGRDAERQVLEAIMKEIGGKSGSRDGGSKDGPQSPSPSGKSRSPR
jgi:hypothetical protein